MFVPIGNWCRWKHSPVRHFLIVKFQFDGLTRSWQWLFCGFYYSSHLPPPFPYSAKPLLLPPPPPNYKTHLLFYDSVRETYGHYHYSLLCLISNPLYHYSLFCLSFFLLLFCVSAAQLQTKWYLVCDSGRGVCVRSEQAGVRLPEERPESACRVSAATPDPGCPFHQESAVQ